MAIQSALTLTGVSAPSPMPIRRVLRAYVHEAWSESRRMLRAPAFAIPFLVLPVPIYLFFGVLLAAPAIAKNPAVANYLFAGFSVFAVMGPALFGAGCALAVERDAGLLRLKRALPAPAGAYILAKLFMGMVFAGAAVATLLVAARVGGTMSLTPAQQLVMAAIMIVGAVPFGAIGLFIGAHTSGSAAPAITNLVFLPMLYLSGLFIPLPKALESLVLIWPAFHLNQTALGAAGVSEFSFIPPAIYAGVLVGVTVVFGGLAIRRLARRG
jgi:ABC-2 type transport system permease protein